MVFSSLVFLFGFLPLALICYYFSPPRLKNPVLLLFSLVFYAWGEPLWIIVLLLNVLLGWCGGLLLDKQGGGHSTKRKAILATSILFQVALLFHFKYMPFLLESLAALTSVRIPYEDPGLPIGISFFTFHLISYLVDVYRGEAPALRSYAKLLLYIAMFPQLVAGPIIRYADVQQQLSRRTVTLEEFSYGISRFAVGLGKKVILANALGELSPLFLDGNLQQLSLAGAWFGIVLFALHIYFDFSGYSDMAIGLGRMFGFKFKENFDYPYISRSATEFWRRWNISVGRFFRDYVYIPMGGNRRRPWLNLFVVWFATGLWHGASWNFVLWGLYFGALIALEKSILLRFLTAMPRWISHLYFIAIVLIGWVFFYFESMTRGVYYLRVMFGLTAAPWIDEELLIHVHNNAVLLILALIGSTPLPAVLHDTLTSGDRPPPLVQDVYRHALVPAVCFTLLALSALLLVGRSYVPFFYFRF